MTANVFTFTITAVDRATAIVKGVNKAVDQSAGKLIKPFVQLNSSVKTLGKEMGLAKFAQNTQKAAGAAKSLAEQSAKIVAPIAAIAGIGAAASIVEMTQAWIDQGTAIARTSRVLGIYQADLQSTQAVAHMFGVGAGETAGALSAFGDTVQGALFGRNQDALALLNRLGVGIKRLKDGSVDTVAMMKQVADSNGFQKGNAEVKRFIASTLGLQGLLPIMLQGSAGIDQYSQKMTELGATMSGPQVARAESFRQSQLYLGAALTGVRNRIVDGLIPAFQPVIDHTTAWIAANRELIGTKVDYYGQRIADAVEKIDWDKVGRGAIEFAHGAIAVVHALGGVKGVAIATAVVLGAPMMTGVVNLGTALLRLGVSIIPVVINAVTLLGTALLSTPIGWIVGGIALLGTAGYELYQHWSDIGRWWRGLWGGMGDDVDQANRKIAGGAAGSGPGAAMPTAESGANALLGKGVTAARARQAMMYFQGKGWSGSAAAGIVANLMKESGLNPAMVGDHGEAQGLAQWHRDRAHDIEVQFRRPLAQMSFREQLAAVNWELQQGGVLERRAGVSLAGASSPEAAGAIVSRMYERPFRDEGQERGALAGSLAASFPQAAKSWNNGEALAFLSGQSVQSAPAMPGPYATMADAHAYTAPAAATGAAVGAENVIIVEFRGAPLGTTATVSGPDAGRISLRIESAMAGVS